MSRKKRSRQQSPPAPSPVAPPKIDPHPPRPSPALLAVATVLLVVWLGFLLTMAMTT